MCVYIYIYMYIHIQPSSPQECLLAKKREGGKCNFSVKPSSEPHLKCEEQRTVFGGMPLELGSSALGKAGIFKELRVKLVIFDPNSSLRRIFRKKLFCVRGCHSNCNHLILDSFAAAKTTTATRVKFPRIKEEW